jgi:23S rRNA (adenine-N6)-dimethyltransferase
LRNQNLKISQNFLKDPNFVLSLLGLTNITNKDTVIEIGPGRGIITQQLVNKAKKVIAIEYDTKLINILKEKVANYPNVEIVEEDFLKWKLPNYSYKVFSNIPFNLTADIVTKLLESKNPPEVSYLIMQDLAAKRFIGQPIGNNSQISILLKPFYDLKIVTKINRNQFEPIPNINIVLAMFLKRKYPLVNYNYWNEYRDFIIYGYNQWKPTIKDSYNKIFSYKQLQKIENKININKKPTELDIQNWIELFNIYLKYVPNNKKAEIRGFEKSLDNRHRKITKNHRTR